MTARDRVSDDAPYAEILPPEGDSRVGYRVFELLKEILDAKNDLNLADKWNRYYQLGINQHWRQKDAQKALISANLLHTHRLKTINLLTDNNPTFNINRLRPEADEGSETPLDDLYEKLQLTAEYWWQEEEQQSIFERSVYNGETYGCAIEKVAFNPFRENGLGEVETVVVDPFHFGFYPVDCMHIQKCEAVLHFYPMNVREARRRWPDVAEDIKSDGRILDDLNDTRNELSQRSGYARNSSRTIWTVFQSVVRALSSAFTGLSDENSDQVLVVECWAKDFSEDENGLPRYSGNIRCVTTCSGGEIVLSDRNNPSISPTLDLEQAMQTYLFDKYPFSMTQSIVDTKNPWGISDFEQLQGLQEEIDKTITQLKILKDRSARAKLINPETSGVDESQFTNSPSMIRPSSAQEGAGIRWMEPPKMPEDVVKILDLYKDFFFLISGVFELESAQTPGKEVIAYQALAALIERAATILKSKIKNYSMMIRERGRMYLSCVMNWYTEDRYISYEQDGEAMSAAINGREMIVPSKLSVVSGSTLPVSKVQVREEAIALYQMQAIDRAELLKRLEWPDRKAVCRRMDMGPLGQFMQYLQMIGVPENMMQEFQQLSGMDPKEVKQGMNEGMIKPFETLLAESQGQGQGSTALDAAQAQLTQMEAQLKQAQAAKIEAERALIAEKTRTEQVDQTVKEAGIEFDKHKLAMERAKTIQGIADARKGHELDRQKAADDVSQRATNDAHSHVMEQRQYEDRQKAEAEKQEFDRQLHEDNMDLEHKKLDEARNTRAAAGGAKKIVKNDEQRKGTGQKGIKSDNEGA